LTPRWTIALAARRSHTSAAGKGVDEGSSELPNETAKIVAGSDRQAPPAGAPPV